MRMRPRGPASPLSRSAVRRPGNVGEMLSHQPARRRQSWLLAWRQRDDGDTTAFAFYHGQTGMQDEAKQTVSAETKTEITLTVHLINMVSAAPLQLHPRFSIFEFRNSGPPRLSPRRSSSARHCASVRRCHIDE